ncbi:MAG: hypothetical protein A2Y79_03800 [Deltaproteobacteria bacterium RBG_13_43_22]|nr:MAG: hypothetical protein A2Y79_03800 [Deltaproteobacteria bacterium RBG_13_43_22]
MADHEISININLDALRGELQRSLQRTIYLVSAGLQSKDKLNIDCLQLPTNNVTMIFDGGLKWDAQTATEQYEKWILSNGFRDIIEHFNSFFESAHKVLAFWELAVKQKDGVKITGSLWNQIIVSGAKSFHRLGLPDKFTHVQDKHGIQIDTKLREQILSSNAARNCLVHRNGVVTELDISASTGFEVRWTNLDLIVQNEDGEKELVLGQIVEKDSVIAMRSREALKTFGIGEQVTFSALEFANIAWTLFLFANDLVQKMSGFGLTSGLIKAPESSST